MESEQEIRARLVRLHGSPISNERGGLVKREQARLLLDVLEIPYDDITGRRQETVESHPDLDLGETECVDLSDYLEEAEAFDNE